LEKLKGKPEQERKKEANQYLAKAVKDFGLLHGATEAPRDKFSMADDKGLQPLFESFRGHAPRSTRLDESFAGLFFDNTPLYLPQPLLSGDSFLYWKTEEKKAYTPNFAEAKPKVIEAWRYLKARDLARQEAKRIEDDARKHKSQGDGLKYLRDESAKHPGWGEMFSLGDIARLKPSLLTGVTGRQYEPFVLDQEKIK